MSEMETKKSRDDTRPSMCGGTRRWSRVPQMTCGAEKSAPMTSPLAMTGQTRSAVPMTRKGSPASPQPRTMSVR